MRKIFFVLGVICAAFVIGVFVSYLAECQYLTGYALCYLSQKEAQFTLQSGIMLAIFGALVLLLLKKGK